MSPFGKHLWPEIARQAARLEPVPLVNKMDFDAWAAALVNCQRAKWRPCSFKGPDGKCSLAAWAFLSRHPRVSCSSVSGNRVERSLGHYENSTEASSTLCRHILHVFGHTQKLPAVLYDCLPLAVTFTGTRILSCSAQGMESFTLCGWGTPLPYLRLAPTSGGFVLCAWFCLCTRRIADTCTCLCVCVRGPRSMTRRINFLGPELKYCFETAGRRHNQESCASLRLSMLSQTSRGVMGQDLFSLSSRPVLVCFGGALPLRPGGLGDDAPVCYDFNSAIQTGFLPSSLFLLCTCTRRERRRERTENPNRKECFHGQTNR